MRGSGCDNIVNALSLDLSQNQLYLGGGFTTAGGQPANYTAKYNLTSGQYSTLGIGKCDWLLIQVLVLCFSYCVSIFVDRM